MSAFSGLSELVTTVAATSVATSVPFGFMAHRVRIVNDGTNSVYFSLSGNAATIASFKLKNGESYDLPALEMQKVGGLSLVCANSETASVRVGAWG